MEGLEGTVEIASVVLWGREIGVVAWDGSRNLGAFEYSEAFLESGIEVSPIEMPLASRVYAFPELSGQTFKGLPGMLADALPDKFGNLLIDQWLARNGRNSESFSPVERLCYMGSRAMGSLEFRPSVRPVGRKSVPIEIGELVGLANEALSRRGDLRTRIEGEDADKESAMNDIIRVGTSAGGARAKAVLAWNPSSGEIRSGQLDAAEGFEHWLLKFDGVSGNRDKEISDPQGYGKVEYAYSLMAKEAGVEMMPCRLLEENGRSHFMTRRFDRLNAEKLHMQTLCGIAHYDFNMAGGYGYEQAIRVAGKLELSQAAFEELFRRMIFNVVMRNQDDHTKNIAFLMDKKGNWRLSPAYDLIYSYNPDGDWTSRHQMTVNGKRDEFVRDDFVAVGKIANLKKGAVDRILEAALSAAKRWPEFAEQAGVPENWMAEIARNHRVLW